jgi:hypothetical protein
MALARMVKSCHEAINLADGKGKQCNKYKGFIDISFRKL